MARHMEGLYGDPALRAADRPLLEGPHMLMDIPPAPAAAPAGARPAQQAGGAGPAGRRIAPAPVGGPGGRGDALASRVMPQGSGAVTTTLVSLIMLICLV
jgi:hypothetical protein